MILLSIPEKCECQAPLWRSIFGENKQPFLLFEQCFDHLHVFVPVHPFPIEIAQSRFGQVFAGEYGVRY